MLLGCQRSPVHAVDQLVFQAERLEMGGDGGPSLSSARQRNDKNAKRLAHNNS